MNKSDEKTRLEEIRKNIRTEMDRTKKAIETLTIEEARAGLFAYMISDLGFGLLTPFTKEEDHAAAMTVRKIREKVKQLRESN